MRIAWRTLAVMWAACAVVAGLWTATVLPGVNLGDGSRGGRAGALAGAAVGFGLLWGLLEALGRLPKLAKKRLGRSVTFTNPWPFPR